MLNIIYIYIIYLLFVFLITGWNYSILLILYNNRSTSANLVLLLKVERSFGVGSIFIYMYCEMSSIYLKPI